MPSVNSKTGNSQQLLGESYFTRNQAFYFALLAIKNAFSLDETRNLQKLRKRRNNATWNLAQMGNKARKILDVAQTLQEQFSAPSAPRQGRVLPYVLSGLIVAAPFIGLFNKEAKAEPVDTGIDLALNTKAPVLPEGSRTSVQPAAHAPDPEIDKAPCADMSACTRKEAYRASTNRIVLHYGEGIVGTASLVRVLGKQGYPTIAIPGAKPGQVELFVNRKMPGKYNQHDLDSGTLGGDAVLIFNEFTPVASLTK